MKNNSKILILIFCFIVVLLSIEQLSYKNTIFADTLAHCCNTGACNSVPVPVPCSTKSTIGLEPNCLYDVNYICQDCMDLIREGVVCSVPSSTYEYCILSNGHRYSTFYGEEIPTLTISISGPTTLQYGVNGTFTASTSGGTTPYHYQWYFLYPNPNYSPIKNGIKPNLPLYDTWYTLGADSPTLTTTFVIDAELKCVVTDVNNTTATSNIMYIHIIMNKISANMSANYELPKETIDDFVLMQNYPNPFNPSTMIKYSIKEQSVVSLRIYDALGKQITELVREQKDPGIYTVEFNANKLSSGIYFYTLTANNFSDTKKMFLVK